MRQRSLIAMFCAAAVSAPVMAIDFTGTWSVDTYCLSKEKSCGNASFELVQTGNRICGNHIGNTANAGRMNEGFLGSVRGTVVGNTAVLVVTSGRNSSVVLGKALLIKKDLRWETLEEITPGEPQGDALVYSKGVLKYLGNEISGELRNACK